MSQHPVPERLPMVRPDYRAVGAVALLAYFVVVGDLGWRDIHPGLRVLSAVLSGALIVLYVARAPGRADRFDGRILLALLVFLVPSIFSRFPRQSFDSALAALLFVSALFVGREILARESARRLFIAGLMLLSASLTLVIAAQLILPFFAWWALTGWTVFPPLDLKVVPQPWALKYELGLLLLLLYPSWWAGHITRPRAVGGAAVGLLVLTACLVIGSRTVWLAAAGGSLAVVLPIVRAGFRWNQRRIAILVAFSILLVMVILVSGLGAAIGERVLRAEPLAERASTWGTLVHAWGDRQLVGYGPGSFPWVLQLTNYFDTNSFAPRHADGAVVQLLVETGFIGVLSALIVLTTVLPAVFRGRSHAARFATTAFLVAGVGLSPAQFPFLVAMAVAWVAYGVPREPQAGSATPGRHAPRLRAVSLGAVAIIGLAFGSTMVAEFAYLSARGAIAAADFREAEAALKLATALDPSLGIYARQLGTLRLISGDPEGAVVALRRATAINPSDDLAWRTLGLAYAEAGLGANSRIAVERAIDVQRSDPTNLLLLARGLRDEGNGPAAKEVLSEIVQAWPLIIAAPGWTEFAKPSSTGELLKVAHDRWARGVPAPEPLAWQPLLIGIMMGLTDAGLADEPAQMTPTLRVGYVAVMRCDANAAAAMGRATEADRRKPNYWALAIRLARMEGSDTRDSQRLYRIMTGDALLSSYRPGLLNPLHENGSRGSSPDLWGYRRQTIDWPDTSWDLPSPSAGYALWHREPAAAAAATGLAGVLRDCIVR